MGKDRSLQTTQFAISNLRSMGIHAATDLKAAYGPAAIATEWTSV